MCAAKRLTVAERKKEIMDSAAKVIVAKGFGKTTMEDIIAGTTLSKGGVYHYYKSVNEIFKDIMISGIDYRNKIIKEHLTECEKGYEDEFMAKHESFNKDNAEEIIRQEIGLVFSEVLTDAGVYKDDENGRKGILRFVEKVNSL